MEIQRLGTLYRWESDACIMMYVIRATREEKDEVSRVLAYIQQWLEEFSQDKNGEEVDLYVKSMSMRGLGLGVVWESRHVETVFKGGVMVW